MLQSQQPSLKWLEQLNQIWNHLDRLRGHILAIQLRLAHDRENDGITHY